jgi:CRISPR system Cascade subunit CasA
MVGAAPPGGWGARLRRDILALAADHEKNAEEFVYVASGGKALLWLEPWDGRAQIPLAGLDPYFIEICRRVRLVVEDGAIVARRGGSDTTRIAVDEGLGGKTGDPWAPYEATKVLTIDGEGFNYRRVAKLLDPTAYSPSPLQVVRREDSKSGLVLHFLATARGQGGTDGFHERRIPVPPRAVLFIEKRRDELAEKAKARVEEAGKVRRNVLNAALFVLFQNAPEKVNYRHPASEAKAAPFLAAFDAGVDRIFFDELFAALEADGQPAEDAARLHWLEALKSLAGEQLTAAEAATPRSGIRRDFSIAAARDALGGLFLHAFPEIKEAANVGD